MMVRYDCNDAKIWLLDDHKIWLLDDHKMIVRWS
jgi:hypothetical protein